VVTACKRGEGNARMGGVNPVNQPEGEGYEKKWVWTKPSPPRVEKKSKGIEEQSKIQKKRGGTGRKWTVSQRKEKMTEINNVGVPSRV